MNEACVGYYSVAIEVENGSSRQLDKSEYQLKLSDAYDSFFDLINEHGEISHIEITMFSIDENGVSKEVCTYIPSIEGYSDESK